MLGKLQRRSKNTKGFTLVELMIVITIIAILATIAIVSFSRVQKQARDTKRKGDLRGLATALQAYFTENNSYPASLTALTPTFIPLIPTPPVGGTTALATSYSYGLGSGVYGLCAELEAPTALWNVDTQNTGGFSTSIAAGCTAPQ